MNNAFTASATCEAAACSLHDLKNWLHADLLHIPPAVPTHGRGRRYSRANVYELALLPAISQAGNCSLSRASELLGGFLKELIRDRAEETNRKFPGFGALSRDADTWMPRALRNRNLDNATIWCVRGGVLRFLASEDYDYHVIGLINVTRLLYDADARLGSA